MKKVVRGLEICSELGSWHGRDCFNDAYKDCPYRGCETGCVVTIAKDAIALLKEQEAKNGEWITIWQENDPDTSTHARCSICNRISERPLGGYRKWCGAKMNQEWGVDG